MSKMLFEEFSRNVAGQIKAFLPERFKDADIDLKVVAKTNNVKFTGLTIKAVDSNIAPTIYLEKFYEDYQDGEDMDQVLQKIASLRLETEAPAGLDVECISDFERCKDKIIPRVISFNLNKELLKERPHRTIEDLAIIYYVELNMGGDTTGGVGVTNGIMEKWGVSLEDINKAAIKNLPLLQKSEFKSLNEVLMGISGNKSDEFLSEDCNMYVLSNVHKMYGASSILDDEMMAHIYDVLEGDFYMIPSSVHEWIVLPKNNSSFDGDSLAAMIKDVNNSTVALEDRLSDHAYVFNIEDGLESV